MLIKAKLRHIGNSLGVILPAKVITCFSAGDEIQVEVITNKSENKPKVITPTPNVITPIEEHKAALFRSVLPSVAKPGRPPLTKERQLSKTGFND